MVWKWSKRMWIPKSYSDMQDFIWSVLGNHLWFCFIWYCSCFNNSIYWFLYKFIWDFLFDLCLMGNYLILLWWYYIRVSLRFLLTEPKSFSAFEYCQQQFFCKYFLRRIMWKIYSGRARQRILLLIFNKTEPRVNTKYVLSEDFLRRRLLL